MDRNGWKKMGWLVCAAALLAAPLMLSGCGSADEAGAQADQRRRIETFTVLNNSFGMIADLEPTIEIIDGTTRYLITANTTVNFTPAGSSPQSFFLVAGEVIIERPLAGTITIIQGF